jgi:hypothetical protein
VVWVPVLPPVVVDPPLVLVPVLVLPVLVPVVVPDVLPVLAPVDALLAVVPLVEPAEDEDVLVVAVPEEQPHIAASSPAPIRFFMCPL